MKLNITLLVILLFSSACKSQNYVEFSYENFENQVILYEPIQKSSITKKDFEYGKMIIDDTKIATKNNPKNFNRADYFNILSAFLTLKESEKNVKTAFEKFKNSERSCEYFIAFEKSVEQNPKYDLIRENYILELQKCKLNEVTDDKVFDLNEYCVTYKLNSKLVELIKKINISDQLYRKNIEAYKAEQNKQELLDLENQKLIDSLFVKHKKYIGKSLVGEKYKHVMWMVIQHSNIEMMEKYLPIIHNAVTDNELSVSPFKMLLDRYYGLKYGFQIYGSQSGFDFELADEKKRKEIEKKYGIQ